MDAEPVRFARTGGSKAIGCIVYALVAPIGGVALGAFLGMLALFGVQALGATEEAGMVAFFVVMGIAFAGVLAWAVRDFRRRAFLEVLLWPDRLEVGAGKSRTVVAFADVAALLIEREGWDWTGAVRTTEGKRVRIPSAVAPFEAVRPWLEETLVAHLAARAEESLRAGGTVKVGESRFRAFCRMGHGITLFLLGPFLIATIRLASSGLGAFVLGRRQLRQGWRGRGGGFEFDKDGLRIDERSVAWSDLTIRRDDDDGVVLATLEGFTASASVRAENFWPAVRIVRERLAARP